MGVTTERLLDAVRAPARQAATLEVSEHRPWPLPEKPWVIAQTLNDQLFAHWRAPADPLRTLLPGGLELDLFEGEAWIGVSPFAVTGLRARGLPPAPFLSSFLELNTRTYVSAEGRPGIWFLSLDMSSELVVEIARRAYQLPFHRADITTERRDDWLSFESRRQETRRGSFRARYRPIGEPTEPGLRSLAYFLTERYRVYITDSGRLRQGEIHHAPWQLQPAEAVIDENTMAPSGLELLDDEPVLHYSAQRDLVVWPPEDA
jgi:uncharacterized protein YqjF (DUF2071 family)